MRRLVLILSLLCLPLSAVRAHDNIQSYNFGVVPQQLSSKLIKNWLPLLKYLSEESGIQLHFATAKDIPAFENNLFNNFYDFAYMNPYHYITYHKSNNYQAIAKEKNKKIRGIIVTRKNSDYKNLQSLAAATIAFPSANAFAATLVTQSALYRNKISFKETYVGSHDSVYYHVALGDFPAGGGVLRTFNALKPTIRSKLTILYTTKGYTPHAFAAHPRVPQQVVLKVQQALVKLATTAAGKKILQDLKLNPVEKATDSDWNDIKQLNLN